jgi:hypothetical protein
MSHAVQAFHYLQTKNFGRYRLVEKMSMRMSGEWLVRRLSWIEIENDCNGNGKKTFLLRAVTDFVHQDF